MSWATDETLDGAFGQSQHSVRFDVLDVDGNQMDWTVHPTIAGTVTFDGTRRITRQLDGLRLDPYDAALLTPHQHRLRPVWVVGSTGAEYPLGVFRYVGGPQRTDTGGTWIDCFTMFDRCGQIDKKRLTSVNILPGTPLTEAFADIAVEHGIATSWLDLAGSGIECGTDPLLFLRGEVSGLDVLNRLATLLAWLPVHANAAGDIVGRRVPVPDDDSPAHTYDSFGTRSRIHEGTLTSTPAPDVANIYVVRSSDTTGITFEYPLPDSAPNSIANGAEPDPKFIDVAGLENEAQAEEIAKAYARRDAVQRTVTWTSDPDPRHGAYEVVAVDGDRLLETGWTLPLEMGPMTHTAVEVFADA